MIYEYFHVARKGQHDQFIQGEGLDTMHDGAWFAVAMVNAYRATGDPFYKEVLTRWQLPFYLKMLNRSDELFTSDRNDGRPGDDRGWRISKEWLLQGREKGFVPYWWDDGGSVSLDMLARKDKDEHVNFAGRNDLAGQPNPERLLSGYSHGSLEPHGPGSGRDAAAGVAAAAPVRRARDRGWRPNWSRRRRTSRTAARDTARRTFPPCVRRWRC